MNYYVTTNRVFLFCFLVGVYSSYSAPSKTIFHKLRLKLMVSTSSVEAKMNFFTKKRSCHQSSLNPHLLNWQKTPPKCQTIRRNECTFYPTKPKALQPTYHYS